MKKGKWVVKTQQESITHRGSRDKTAEIFI